MTTVDPISVAIPVHTNGTTSAAVLRSIFPGGNACNAGQKLTDFKAKVDGPLFLFGGGDVRIAFGAETTRKEIDAQNYRLIPQSAPSRVASNGGSRRDNAAFVEINIPLVGGASSMPGVRRLELSLAGRYDDYSDFGSTTNPKFALNWSPVEGFMVRGSASSSFQAPSLSNTDLNVAVDNVFDRDPPFDLTAGGYNSTRNASTLGRLVSLSIRKTW